MNERTIQERFETLDKAVIGEWEDSTRFDVSQLSARDVASLVRAANRKAKHDGEWVRFRSVAVEDQFA